MNRSAEFSPCRLYRYTLWRWWGPAPGDVDRGYVVFVGLNPSTADEVNDDPTIRRCIAFARAWGFSGVCMVNLFAFRSKEPADMLAAADPVGPENDAWLKRLTRGAGLVVAAWGVHGTHMERDTQVKQLIPEMCYLRLTKDGHPGHPLYLPKTLLPQPFRVAEALTS